MPVSILNKLLRWISIVVFAVLSASCSSHEGGQISAPTPMGKEHCKQADPALQAKLATALDMVELGWSRAQVEEALGTPDYVEPSANKTGSHLTGEVLYYVVISCATQPRVGSGDQFVALLFDSSGSLYAVEPEQVPGVKHRAEPVSK